MGFPWSQITINKEGTDFRPAALRVKPQQREADIVWSMNDINETLTYNLQEVSVIVLLKFRIWLFVYVNVRPSVSVCLSACTHIRLFICLSVCLSACQPARRFVCLSVSMLAYLLPAFLPVYKIFKRSIAGYHAVRQPALINCCLRSTW